MDFILKQLRDTFDHNAVLSEFNTKDKLTIYLTNQYRFYIAEVLGCSFVIAWPREELSVLHLEKHIANIEMCLGYPVALFFNDLSEYKRKKLMERRISFISGNKQVFLPFIGFSLQNEKKAKIKELREGFAPGTQLIYLYILFAAEELFTQNEIVNALQLSPMTVSRALKQLTALQLLECTISGQTGRKKNYRRIEKKAYYENGYEFLKNPVKRTVYVNQIPKSIPYLQSGLSALAEKSMLNAPDHDIFAVANQVSSALETCIVTEEEGINEKYPQIQIMKYDVTKLAKNNMVDELTLILSLDHRDERIDMAINEMMEEYEWYEE